MRDPDRVTSSASRASLQSDALRSKSVRSKGRRWALLAGALLLVALVSVELFARLGIGLGDPPLTQRDAAIDYLFAPSRCYQRFHKTSCYNRWSMRSSDFDPHKRGCEARVMVLGDSIVNAGVSVDQSGIATEIVRRRLDRAGVKNVVGNISAGSWGPANLLAYTDRFGWFDADVAVFVFNSGDVVDLPDFRKDLGPDYPSSRPWTALEELWVRYLPRYLPAILVPTAPAVPAPTPAQRARGLEALELLLRRAGQHVARRVVVLHFEAGELARGFPDERIFRELSERTGARFISLRELESPALYSDHIHLNAEGQEMLGQVISEAVRPWLAPCPT